MSNIKWPKSVPVLEEDNMCHYVFSDRDGRHCLLGWVNETFNSLHENPQVFTKVLTSLQQVLNCKNGEIIFYNDKNTREQNAHVWNKTMKKLGYTEIS